ncbi:hypothetical protein [Salmonella phage GSP032]|uniref:Uncharacterized protein n=1 Tax=Salmonella phage GSP032 TaxID=2962599 RepID=A0AAX3C1G2_9CAUD|nr:hypothetical protein [Salmonella phage GSP032]
MCFHTTRGAIATQTKSGKESATRPDASGNRNPHHSGEENEQ